MKNLFYVDIPNATIYASKTTLKKTRVPNSPEYNELVGLLTRHHNFKIVEKEIKKAKGKETYKGLTSDFIKQYISIQKNKETLEAQYKEAFKLGKFPLVRKWFLDTFKNFDMEQAKAEIENVVLGEIRTITASTDANQTTTKPSLVSTLVEDQALAAD